VPTPRASHTWAVLLASVLWGTTGTVAHFAPAGASPALIGLSTFGFGGLLLFLGDRRRATAVLRGRAGRGWLVAGAVGVLMYASMYYLSMSLVGVAVGNVLALGSGPLFAALMEYAVDRDRPSAAWWVATAFAVTGIAVLGLSAPGGSGTAPVAGVLLALGAGLGYGCYSFAGARLIARDTPSTAVLAAMFTLAAVVLLPWFVVAGPGPLVSTPRGLLILAYLAVFPMAVAYLLFGFGLRRLSASSATTLALFEPLVATMLAVGVVGERLEPVQWAGLLLIVTGIVLVARAETGAG
jgi:drug/metabolite transporter, DME family